jgi:hypothetical protein
VSHGSCTGRGEKKCGLGALEGRPRTQRDNVGYALFGEDRTQRERRKEVQWCEGRSGTEDRTPLDILVTVE